MSTLARRLQSRSHDVVFISLPDGEAAVRAAGLEFVPCGTKEYPLGSLKERLRWLSKLQGEEALQATLQNVAVRTEAMLNSVPALLTATRVDPIKRRLNPQYKPVRGARGSDFAEPKKK